ncbi:hypothetical protein D3C80_1996630 [compost metagenome]
MLISCADMVSARVLRCMPPLERPIGVRPKSTMTASLGFRLINSLSLYSFRTQPKNFSPLAAISRNFAVGWYSGPRSAYLSARATNSATPMASM